MLLQLIRWQSYVIILKCTVEGKWHLSKQQCTARAYVNRVCVMAKRKHPYIIKTLRYLDKHSSIRTRKKKPHPLPSVSMETVGSAWLFQDKNSMGTIIEQTHLNSCVVTVKLAAMLIAQPINLNSICSAVGFGTEWTQNNAERHWQWPKMLKVRLQAQSTMHRNGIKRPSLISDGF